MTTGPHETAGQSPAGLFGDVVTGITRLVKGEIALARAEAERSLHDALGALAIIVIAAILAITALNVLAGAAIAALIAAGLTPVGASLVVGIALLAIAFGMLQYARHRLTPQNLAPKRSFLNLRRDAKTFKSMVNPDATSTHHAS